MVKKIKVVEIKDDTVLGINDESAAKELVSKYFPGGLFSKAVSSLSEETLKLAKQLVPARLFHILKLPVSLVTNLLTRPSEAIRLAKETKRNPATVLSIFFLILEKSTTFKELHSKVSNVIDDITPDLLKRLLKQAIEDDIIEAIDKESGGKA